MPRAQFFSFRDSQEYNLNRNAEVIYQIPHEKEILGFQTFAMTVAASPIILVPTICASLDYYVGASILTVVASFIPLSFIKLWTRNLVQKVWVLPEEQQFEAGRVNSSSRTSDGTKTLTANSKRFPKKSILALAEKPRQLEDYLKGSFSKPIFYISSFKFFGSSKITKVSLADISVETIQNQPNGKPPTMIKLQLNPKTSGSASKDHVYLLVEMVHRSPILQTILKSINLQTYKTLNKDSSDSSHKFKA
ncbi:hypothetical protein BB560_002477 [Smittium megazygosporum]|uniref:Uncharacterized protein n=1 Tax=Smittium megazygosporum TaxID=133381 RepID=A0A2T9ZEM6_9FUNG|nr:hypothetical protein BB560_002477 [Smittium megazygosporum]